MLQPPIKFEVRRRHTYGFSISLVTLTFDLLTSTLVRIIALGRRGVSNFPTNLGVSGTFRSRLMSQHLSDGPCTWPCDLDLWPWRSLRLTVIQLTIVACWSAGVQCRF